MPQKRTVRTAYLKRQLDPIACLYLFLHHRKYIEKLSIGINLVVCFVCEKVFRTRAPAQVEEPMENDRRQVKKRQEQAVLVHFRHCMYVHFFFFFLISNAVFVIFIGQFK